MINIAVFLGACIVVYAIFNYLEAKLFLEQSFELNQEFIKQYGDEFLPEIIENVTENVTSFLIGYMCTMDLEEAINESNKEEISKTGAENNKEFKRD